jgi:hypothetical protein
MSILAPFLFNAGAKYKVRVSAHSDGLIARDRAGEEYKANRDYIEINLGREYYLMSENYEKCLIGFDDIMYKRFNLANRANFSGLENVLGKAEELSNLGSVIKKLAAEKKLRGLHYVGSHVFVKLCSGDLSYLVDILGLMYSRWGDKKFPIGKDVQNDVIRNYSKKQLHLLKDQKTSAVSSLYDVGFYFGNLSRKQLIHKGTEYLRIEIEINELEEKHVLAIKELLSAGLFIDGDYSTTSSGKPARKLLYRRIYTPAFPTTVNQGETISMRKKNFDTFITDPKKYYETSLSSKGISSQEQPGFDYE